jgi:hypothetical protein
MKDPIENSNEQNKEVEKSSKNIPDVNMKKEGEASPKQGKTPENTNKNSSKGNEKVDSKKTINKIQLDPSEILPIEESFQPKM